MPASPPTTLVPHALLSGLLAVVAVSSSASCQRYRGALDVELSVASDVKADCLKVSLLEGDEELRSTVFPRAPGKTTYKVAVVPSEAMPRVVQLSASGWLGPCDDEGSLTLNTRTTPTSVPFPAEEIAHVALVLEAPPREVDADGDGYRAAAAEGPDCHDDDATVHPGAAERCEAELDADCDGLAACADPQCAAAAACLEPPDRLALGGLPATLVARGCASPLWVELKDATGPQGATRATAIALGGAEFFDQEGCSGSRVDAMTMAFTQSRTATFSARFPTPGVATVTAQAEGLASTATSVLVEPTPVAALSLTGALERQAAGACGAPLTVTLLDADGLPTASVVSQTVALEAQPSEPTGSFFTDDDCGGEAKSQLVVPAGQATGTFRFRATRAGSVTLTARAAGRVASTSLEVAAGPARRVAFVNAPLALRASECSSVRKAVLRVELEDDFGNRTVAAAPVTASLSVAGVSLTFSDAATGQCEATVSDVTIAAGTSEAGLLVRSGGAGSGTVTLVPTNGFATTSQPISVAAGEPQRLRFVTGPQTPLAGQCTAAETTLEVRDGSDLPTSFAVDTLVALTTTHLDPGFHFFSQPGCPADSQVGTSLRIPAGQSAVRLYFRGEKQANFNIMASAEGVLSGTLNGNWVRAALPAWLLWAPPATPVVLAGDCSPSFTLQVRDAFQNLTSFEADQTLTLASVPAGLSFDVAPGACQAAGALVFPAGTSSVSVQARGLAAGTYQLSASTGAVSTTAETSLSVQPGPTAHLTFVGLPSSRPVGVCSGALRLRREDAHHNATTEGALTATVSGETLTFATGAQCASAGPSASVSFADGSSLSSEFSVVGSSPGQQEVTAAATTGTATATATFEVTPPAPHHLRFVTSPFDLDAGTCSGRLTLELRDADDVPMSSPSLAVGLAASASGVSFYSDPGCTTGPVSGLTLSGSTVDFSFLPTEAVTTWLYATSPALPDGGTDQRWSVK